MVLCLLLLVIMFERTFVSIIIVVLCGAYCYNCLSVIPERAVIKYANEKYVSNATVSVRRSSRRGQYVFNIRLINKTVLGNNVTFHVTIYEHSNRYNQYVRTMMELNYKWCELVLRDVLFGPMLRTHGLKQCPIPPGPIVMTNLTYSGNFPFDVLFDKGKIEAIWKVGSNGEVIGSIDVFVHFSKPK